MKHFAFLVALAVLCLVLSAQAVKRERGEERDRHHFADKETKPFDKKVPQPESKSKKMLGLEYQPFLNHYFFAYMKIEDFKSLCTF